MKRQLCYVCGKKIRGEPQPVGHDLYRHRTMCQPGSVNWARKFPQSTLGQWRLKREGSEVQCESM